MGALPTRMIFQERKTDTGYTYDLEDVFGTLHIVSTSKVSADLLDSMVVLLLRQNLTAGTVEGEVKHKDGTVQYIFKKAPLWEDDDENEPCEDTPTSTEKQESASTQTRPLKTPGSSWWSRFAGAFREALRSAKKDHDRNRS